jgi:hypothetical protein
MNELSWQSNLQDINDGEMKSDLIQSVSSFFFHSIFKVIIFRKVFT